MPDNKPKILVITGPTASGKTSVSVDVCKSISGEIVSADSMQIYKYMTICTAKPTQDELQGIKCHLIDYIEPDESYNVYRYKNDADLAIKKVLDSNHIPVLCGGTGLYIDTVIKNTDLSHNSNNQDVRNELMKKAEIMGNDYLYKQLYEVDNLSAARIHPNDRKRIIRSLEIFITTGKKQSDWDAESNNNESNYNPYRVLLTYRNREALYNRINKRVNVMVESGLIEEARYIYNSYDHNKISAIGYPELFKYFDGVSSLEDSINQIKQYSRNYAKRQLTWFRKCDFESIYYMDDVPYDYVVNDIISSFSNFILR